jgi:hypothetical protein
LEAAILGSVDAQRGADAEEQAERFERFCEKTTPLKLCDADFPLFEPFPVYVFTHEGIWVSGVSKQTRLNSTALHVEFNRPIPGGTSGSPVVNDEGEVLGVISWVSEPNPNALCAASVPRPMLTLPVWTVQQIQRSAF